MPVGAKTQSDYRILVSRSNTRPKAELYRFNLQNLIPCFALPLNPNEIEPALDLKTILDEIYDRAGYSFRIDYRKSTQPALSLDNQQWATRLINHKS